MLNTLSGAVPCVKCHLLISSLTASVPHCTFPRQTLLWWDELIYYSGLSVSEEGQQDGGAGREGQGCAY